MGRTDGQGRERVGMGLDNAVARVCSHTQLCQMWR